MSASLVGSEMCIRDRSSRRSLPFRCACAWVAPTCQHHAFGAPAQTRCSVSYTHLTLPTICSV
eukprot:4907130-Alexandrium_andersonii.AAC.1